MPRLRSETAPHGLVRGCFGQCTKNATDSLSAAGNIMMSVSEVGKKTVALANARFDRHKQAANEAHK